MGRTGTAGTTVGPPSIPDTENAPTRHNPSCRPRRSADLSGLTCRPFERVVQTGRYPHRWAGHRLGVSYCPLTRSPSVPRLPPPSGSSPGRRNPVTFLPGLLYSDASMRTDRASGATCHVRPAPVLRDDRVPSSARSHRGSLARAVHRTTGVAPAIRLLVRSTQLPDHMEHVQRHMEHVQRPN